MTNCVEGSISVKEHDFALGQRRQFLDRLSRSPEIIRGELEPVARLVTECVSRIIDAERVSVWLFNDTETELRCVDLFELSTVLHSSGAVLLEHEFSSEFQAMKNASYVDADEPLCDPRTAGYSESYLKPNRITAMLDVVLRLGGRNLGVLC
ncbi:MAG TPA: GAF domain-containing protein, partial [Labilithrix sp.]|nr:GAF domain-containing protein [Labilithrix sp.]